MHFLRQIILEIKKTCGQIPEFGKYVLFPENLEAIPQAAEGVLGSADQGQRARELLRQD